MVISLQKLEERCSLPLKPMKVFRFLFTPMLRLLQQGFRYVLSERFLQDVLEDYFGHQCAKGRTADNLTAYDFGYNELTIEAQRDIALVVRGNVGGRYEKKKWYFVSNGPN